MKYDFIVSAYRKTWIDGSKRLFLAEPYVYHVLKKNGELQKYEEIQVGPYLWQSRDDLQRAQDFVDQKYHKYVHILANRLNEIHNKNYDNLFWKKCFSLGLIRYITFFYEMFQVCETNFRPEQHSCRILSEKSYYIPVSFNDHRQFFQHTNYGYEQIFSIYVNLFYPQHFLTIDDQFYWNSQSRDKKVISRLFRITPEKILRRIKIIWRLKILRRFNSYRSPKRPKVGIINCLFSEKYLKELIIKSRGRIRQIPIKTDFNFNTSINWEKRKALSIINRDFDKFDRLFFTSLQYCLPREFVEGFDQVASHYIKYFERYQNLKFVVSETWIGDTYISIALAILQAQGIKHIYNEHNYLCHQFLGNNSKYIFPLVDFFITLGWYNKSIPNLIKGASLFEWVIDKKFPKEHDILFISGLPQVKVPEFNASYGESGAINAQRYLEFNRLFFNQLGPSTIQSIVFRGYPALSVKQSLVYDQYHTLNEHLWHCKVIDDKSPSAKILMLRSKLVIVNYLSASYIEAMLANVPTIFFWNKESYYLDNEYLDFYDPLISVGICQTDPIKAALFVEQIKDNPEKWWHSKPVQKAKEAFLLRNMGSPQIMMSYLLELIRTE